MEDSFYFDRIRFCWNCHEYYDQIDECPCKKLDTSNNSDYRQALRDIETSDSHERCMRLRG